MDKCFIKDMSSMYHLKQQLSIIRGNAIISDPKEETHTTNIHRIARIQSKANSPPPPFLNETIVKLDRTLNTASQIKEQKENQTHNGSINNNILTKRGPPP